MFELISVIITWVLLSTVAVKTINDYNNNSFEWMPVYAIATGVLLFILFHYTDLLCKL